MIRKNIKESKNKRLTAYDVAKVLKSKGFKVSSTPTPWNNNYNDGESFFALQSGDVLDPKGCLIFDYRDVDDNEIYVHLIIFNLWPDLINDTYFYDFSNKDGLDSALRKSGI